MDSCDRCGNFIKGVRLPFTRLCICSECAESAKDALPRNTYVGDVDRAACDREQARYARRVTPRGAA